jgi:hypothetical protein
MNPIVYNVSNTIGLVLVGVGLGIERLSFGLAAAGIIVIALNIYAAEITRRGAKMFKDQE